MFGFHRQKTSKPKGMSRILESDMSSSSSPCWRLLDFKNGFEPSVFNTGLLDSLNEFLEGHIQGRIGTEAFVNFLAGVHDGGVVTATEFQTKLGG